MEQTRVVWPPMIPLVHPFHNYPPNPSGQTTSTASSSQYSIGPSGPMFTESVSHMESAARNSIHSGSPQDPNFQDDRSEHPSGSNSARRSPKQEPAYTPAATELYSRAQINAMTQGGDAFGISGGQAAHFSAGGGVTRLPPILQVEKQQVTTSATQIASANRRRNEAHFVCPVPGCGSTFTRRFNLRGHLRSHTEERPYICEWPGCKKGFARQHDCKRHQALHVASKSQTNTCQGCKKQFSRLDALNRHLRSEGGSMCREIKEENSGGHELRAGDASGQ